MRKSISIMQPTYMPWMGYFSMINKVDEFVFLDSVQLVGRSWQVRNKIKLNDEEKLLTIPIDKSLNRNERMIYNTRYFGEEWKESHLGTIQLAYHKAPFFLEVFPFLQELYYKEYFSLGEFTSRIIENISRQIGIETPFYYSSKMDKVEGRKDTLLVNICKNRKAKAYLSAQGSAVYIEKEAPGGEFVRNDIDLCYQNYIHPEYSQLGNRFISHIGIYDLLFNVGFHEALGIIIEGDRTDIDYSEFVLGDTYE